MGVKNLLLIRVDLVKTPSGQFLITSVAKALVLFAEALVLSSAYSIRLANCTVQSPWHSRRWHQRDVAFSFLKIISVQNGATDRIGITG